MSFMVPPCPASRSLNDQTGGAKENFGKFANYVKLRGCELKTCEVTRPSAARRMDTGAAAP
jgi:hypothetical protein